MLCFTIYAMRVRVVACMCAMSRCELPARYFLLTHGQHLPAKQDNKILSMNSWSFMSIVSASYLVHFMLKYLKTYHFGTLYPSFCKSFFIWGSKSCNHTNNNTNCMFVCIIQNPEQKHAACRMHAYVLCTWYVITNTHDGVTCICMSSLYVRTYVTKLASSSAYKCTCLRYVCICM